MEKKDENRTLRISRNFKASVSQIWNALTNPEAIAAWWGPKGFSTSVQHMDVRKGGEWRLILHEPDGTNYPNRSVYLEIVPHQKIVFEHFNPHFITTLHFTGKGQESCVDWSMLFDSEEQYATIVTAHKADQGLFENMQKLEHYLAQLQTAI